MDKRRIKRSVVTCAVLVGLSVSPQAQAGFFSDILDGFNNTFEEIKNGIEEVVDDVVGEVTEVFEESVVFLLQNGVGKGADYLIGLMLQLDGLDGKVIFDLLVELMKNDQIITDEIMIEMIYNESMVGLIEKSISAANTDLEKQQRAEEFFAVAVERFMPILMAGEIQIDVDKIPSSAIAMFSNLGTVDSNNDGLEKAWEDMFRLAMSSGPGAQAFFGLLMQLDPAYQQAMMDFMFLAKTGDGQFHTAESMNFIQAMVEGMMNGLNAGTMTQEDLGMLVQSLMPILATFDAQGNMTGMTPYGERFFTVVASKAMTCQDPAAGQFAQMMMGMMPPGMILPVITNTEVCGTEESAGRIVDPDAIALINSGAVTYMDSDEDGVPDFMDRFPGVDNRIDTDSDGIPDGADADIDGDGIPNDADADVDGDGVIDNGTDTDSDGTNDAHDSDIDGDGISNEADSDVDGDGIMDNGPDADNDGINDAHDTEDNTDTDNDGIPDTADADIDGDGIPNEADADVDGDGIIDNGPDTDSDGINDANDPDIDGDGIPNETDADVDGDGVNDNGTDTDSDGINDANDPDIDGDGIPNEADVDVNGDGTNDNGTDTDGDGINNANDSDIDGDGIDNSSDTDIDGDGIDNQADADADGDGVVENGPDTDNDGINDANDPDIDGDGISNEADVDPDGDGTNDNGTDSDGDGINDAHDTEDNADTDNDGIINAEDPDIDGDGIPNEADADVDGDGVIDNGPDTDNDGINDEFDVDVDGDGVNDNGEDTDDDGISDGNGEAQTITETIIYFYGEDGVLRDNQFNSVVNVDFNNDPNLISNVVIMMPGNKSVVMEVDMDLLYTDEEGNRFIVSELLDDKGSRFIISMTVDGFGKVFIGNDEGGFEMSGNLAGMKENEELVFSVVEMEDGKLAGKTTIKPKDKALTFGSSVFN